MVFISAEPFDDQVEPADKDDVFERVWFDQADIFFEEYHLINHDTEKEDAQRLIQEASTIFLCGGYPQYQMELLRKFELRDLIKKSDALVMGASAGGMNMSESYVDEGKVYAGLALNHFSFEAHFDYADIMLVKERFTLSKEMNVYVAADQDGAVIVRGSNIDIIGNVYLVSHSQINKLAETKLFTGLN
jgi:cyanophycinase